MKSCRKSKEILNALRKYIDPLDNLVVFHLSQYSLKIWEAHRNKHREIFTNIEAAEKQFVRQGRTVSRIRATLAKRHGWNGI